VRRQHLGAPVAAVLLALTASALTQVSAQASPNVSAMTSIATETSPGQDGKASPDLPTNPNETKRETAKRDVARKVITGQAKVQHRGGSRAVEVSPGKWVEYGTQDDARLLTFLVEYGQEGPLHNEIPEPDEANTSTTWTADYSAEHYQELFFADGKDDYSFKTFYQEQSSGRLDISGAVSDWLTLPHSGQGYWADTGRILKDAAQIWYDQEVASGKTPEEITEYLKSFDVWDRNDYDDDGDFDEPDGYIDHFQTVHAGIGQEAGGPAWSVWSHRGWVGWSSGGGPSWNKSGGIRIGDTDLWILDYTIEPENGGLGVFAHEFGHDLGLPDYFEGAGFWSTMAQGGWLGRGDGEIGTIPGGLDALSKLELGWSDFVTVEAGDRATVDMGPAFHATSKAQAVVVNLPPGVSSTTEIGNPYSGTSYLYGGRADNLSASVTSPSFVVPDDGMLTAKVAYDIEADWDYAYLEVVTEDDAVHRIPTNLSSATDPHGVNLGQGVTGSSGDAGNRWVDLSADLSSYAGRNLQVRFHYITDGGTTNLGFKVDDIAVGDVLAGDVDDGLEGWSLNGFTVVENGSIAKTYDRFYIAENRTYGGFDQMLKVGPYEFNQAVTNSGGVVHYPYQDGLLIWYATNLPSNGGEQIPTATKPLPIDAHPQAESWSDGSAARVRLQGRDATFGLGPTDPLNLTKETTDGTATLSVPALPAVSIFDDTDAEAYYDPDNPAGSTHVAGTGTTIEVLAQNTHTGALRIQVNGFEAWEASTTYLPGDRVEYDGATWRATRRSRGLQPTDGARAWEKVR